MLATDNQIKEIDFFSYAPDFGVAAPITVRVDIGRQTELLAESNRLRIAVITNVESVSYTHLDVYKRQP